MDESPSSSSPDPRKPIPKVEGIEVDESELQRLSEQPCLSEGWTRKLEVEAQKNWDKFYMRNEDKFFKDRHWGKAEMEKMCENLDFKVSSYLFISIHMNPRSATSKLPRSWLWSRQHVISDGRVVSTLEVLWIRLF